MNELFVAFLNILGWEIGKLILYKFKYVRFTKEDAKLTIDQNSIPLFKKQLKGYTRLKWYQWLK